MKLSPGWDESRVPTTYTGKALAIILAHVKCDGCVIRAQLPVS